MRRFLALVVGSVLLATALSAAPCAPSPTTLCLNDSRFEVEVSWRDSRGRTGVGQAKSITPDTGYFWFFAEANIELVIKVLDARSINQKYWVFFGALTSVEFDLTVTDTTTGAVKRYHNDLGNFASVGDTGAFEPVAPARGPETVTVEGFPTPPDSLEAIQGFIDASVSRSAAAFTPCRETTFGFLLNGCRFHIEVSWRDSRGRSGDGQPVQLTNDTGYFWFFAPANVELMVKVLDARSVNGDFWVFFGALSSVEFALTVTDTVTGVVRRYANALGTFASVGDTGAFLGGYSVAPVRDSPRGTTAELDHTGGTIVAHGADGSTFTLAIPPDALDGPQTITLTPVSRIDRLPYSGGLIAGVELEPEGLRLRVPATLTIDPAVSPAPPNHILTYAYAKGGENLILYPGLDGDAVALPILHFSGYGAGSGTAGDAEAGSETPAGPLQPYVQQYAGAWFEWQLKLITLEERYERGIEIFSNAYTNVVVRQLNGVKESCDKAELQLAMKTAFDFLRFIQVWGFGEDERMKAFTPQVFELADEILRACQQKAYDRCVSRNDPFQIVDMLYIARQLQMLGDEDPYLTTFIEDGLMESCLRFEIDFESKLVEEHHSDSGVTTLRMKYRAQQVPLRFNYGGNDFGRAIWEGACTLLPVVLEFEPAVPFAGSGCSLTIEPSNGRFDVKAAWIGVMDDPSVSAVRVLYDPGNPTVNAVLHCEDQDPIPLGVFQWYGEYGAWHHSEFSQGYGGALFGAKNWEQLSSGEFFAKKSYERERVELDSVKIEETWFFLKHTPGAPMPQCP